MKRTLSLILCVIMLYLLLPIGAVADVIPNISTDAIVSVDGITTTYNLDLLPESLLPVAETSTQIQTSMMSQILTPNILNEIDNVQDENSVLEIPRPTERADCISQKENLHILNEVYDDGSTILEQNSSQPILNSENVINSNNMSLLGTDNFQTVFNTVTAPAVANGLLEPKTLDKNLGQEDISPYSGEMTLRFNDISLPGRNGLDLNIGRIYQTAQSNIGDKVVSIVPKQNGTGFEKRLIWDYSNYYNDRYYLGTGWSFDFPSVQIAKEYNPEEVGDTYFYQDTFEVYYHTGNGSVFQVDFTEDQTDSNLKDYYKKDVIFNKEDTGYTNGQVTSYYSFTLPDKTKQYFAQDGRLLGIVDRFSNEIKFEHTMKTTTNRVPNGNFKTGTNLWTRSSDSDVDVISDKGRYDSSSLEFFGRSYNEISITSSPIVVEPQQVYALNASFFSTYGDNVTIQVWRFDENLGYRSDQTFTTGNLATNVWNDKEWQFSTSSATRYIFVKVIADDNSRGLFIDDVSVDRKKPLITKITDTIGREISFSYTGELNSSENLDITVKTPDKTSQKLMNYTKKYYEFQSGFTGDYSEKRLARYLFDSNVEDAEYKAANTDYGMVTYTYDGDIINGARSLLYTNPNYPAPIGNEYYNKPVISEIGYKYSKKLYTYEQTRKNLGDSGFYDTLRVKSRYEQNGFLQTQTSENVTYSGEENKATFSYSGMYNGQSYDNETGYPNYKFTSETTLGEVFKCTQTGKLISKTKFSNGKMVSQNVNNGINYLTEYTYHPTFKDQPTQVKNTVGTNISYVNTTYNSWGGIATQTKPIDDSIVDVDKYTTSFAYDATYKFVTSTSYYNDKNEPQLTETKQYDSLGRLIKSTNANGDEIHYYYENNTYTGNLTKSVQDDVIGMNRLIDSEKIITCTYDSYNAYVAQVSDNGKNTQYEYEYIWGNVKREVLPEGEKTYLYDIMGRIIQNTYPFIQADGKRIKLIDIHSYGIWGFIGYETNIISLFMGENIKSAVADEGSSSASIIGVIDKYSYVNGDLKAVRKQDRNRPITGGYATIKTYYHYDTYSRPTKVKDDLSHETSYIYDVFDRLTQITDAKGGKYVTEYDDVNKTKLSYFKNTTSVTENHIKEQYDLWGRTLSVSAYPSAYPNSPITQQYEYNITGNPTKITDPKTNSTYYSYNKLGKLTKTILPNGTYTTTNYNQLDKPTFEKQYDENNNILSGRVSLFDDSGNIISKFYKDGLQIQQANSYSSDNMGRTTSKNEGENQYTYSYDQTGNLTNKTSGISQVDYRYNQYGLSFAQPNNQNTTYLSYSYNKLGQITQKLQDSYLIENTYKPIGLLETSKTPFNLSIGYTYDENNRLKNINSESKNYIYDYYEDGNLKSILYPNGILSFYTYDNLNRILNITTTKGANSIYTLVYTYDANSNILTETKNGVTTTYTYDSLNRLKTANYGDSNTITYEYDALNNKVSESHTNGLNKQFDYDKSKRLTKITTNGAVTDTYSYNQTGAVLTHNNDSFNYDEWDNLESYTNSNNVTTTYKYDSNGIRTKKNNLDYVVDLNNNVIAENGDTTTQMIYGHKPLARKEGSVYYYYIYNAHGDVIGMANETGSILNSYTYDAWGQLVASNETISNPIRYAGEYQDTETGFYYLRARYYDPKVGRFTSLDKVEGDIAKPIGMNRYVYCNNNPVNKIDPTGLASYFITVFAGINTTKGNFDQVTPEIARQIQEKDPSAVVNYKTIYPYGNGLTDVPNVGMIALGVNADSISSMAQQVKDSYDGEDYIYFVGYSGGGVAASKTAEKLNSDGWSPYISQITRVGSPDLSVHWKWFAPRTNDISIFGDPVPNIEFKRGVLYTSPSFSFIWGLKIEKPIDLHTGYFSPILKDKNNVSNLTKTVSKILGYMK